MTSALLVDDHPMMLQGCRNLLQDIGVAPIHEATDVRTGYGAFLKHRPDVVIVDLTLAGDDLGGLSLIQRIIHCERKTRILVLSMHNDPAIVKRTLDSGVAGYVLKDSPSSEFVNAFERVAAGATHLSHDMAVQVALLHSKSNELAAKNLSDREMQILSLLANGNNYDQIGVKLAISYSTVTNACSSMRTKLQVRTLADLIRFAVQNDRGGSQ
ncbi:response regulator transcription factor [Bradyrhizobium sp. SZCCHNS2005]|uniref:response regulator transcription factor n=1 Tax=Bradyrhizobium sp. SZCCHNS2005 TaxID=3057303 RepID=UPI0028E1E88E|nr:response regulator transcription factor [Bradyrhizobium sp. SZCCHNS2005]